MLNIITALTKEAKPIIKKYNLKPNNQIYQNSYLNLIITGQGKIKSAINTALLLSKYPYPTLNIGIAGSNKYNINSGFFINKIIDFDTKYEYFPDFFDENAKTLTTLSLPNRYFEIVDLEGSGFFEACYKFLSVEKIILYKIISDTPTTPINPDNIENLISNHLFVIEKLLDTFKQNSEIEEILKEAKQKMYLTKTQEIQLKNLLIYFKTINKNITIKKTKNKKETQEFLNYLTSLIS